MRKIVTIIIMIFLLVGGFNIFFNTITPRNNVSAISVSGTIITSQVWSGTVLITGDVIIANNSSITIQPGTVIQFNHTSYKITVEDGYFNARGTQNQHIIFMISAGKWNTIEVLNSSYARFFWCEFRDTENGINITNNGFRTTFEYCRFNNTGTYYFQLTNSQITVASSWFEDYIFEEPTNLTNNLNKVKISDFSSELFIEYFIEVSTTNGLLFPLSNINVNVQSISGINRTHQYQGTTDAVGQYTLGRTTSFRIYSISPNLKMDDAYNTSVEVWDKWFGTSKTEPGISKQTTFLDNNSLIKKNNLLRIPLYFIFDYPPRIDTIIINKIIVEEDKLENVQFFFHDNDDYFNGDQNEVNRFDNITILIKDQYGNDIYDIGDGDSTKSKWVRWTPESGGKLILYRTIESPYTPPGPNSYRAKVEEKINVTIIDDNGHAAWTGLFNVDYYNIPDKPVINFNSTVEVKEDIPKYIPISISDADNQTSDIQITIDSPYVTFEKSNSTLKFLLPNEFGGSGEQLLVNVSATDNCYAKVDSTLVKNIVTQRCNIIFYQTPDAPEILGSIPNMVGNESDWSPTLDLKTFWSDLDPDDDHISLKWYVTGVNTDIFDVSGDNVTANTPLVFNLKPDLELGGADDPVTIEDEVTIWLKDRYGLTDSQKIKLILSSTNLQPSLHKVDKFDDKITVDPEYGDSEILYTFMVEYRDLDGKLGDTPEYVKVVIDNVYYDMLETNENDKNYLDGKKYFYETRLEHGEHEHYFICSDGDLIARLPDGENTIQLPIVEDKIYINEFYSSDTNIIAEIAYTGKSGTANITFEEKPNFDKDDHQGDFGIYFSLNPQNMKKIYWIQFKIDLGKNYTNYGSIWLRKSDMQLAYLDNESWVQFYASIVLGKDFTLLCNITPELAIEFGGLIQEILSGSNIIIFTVIGWLDADNDGYFNSEDAFPLDPAARYDRDNDGSPGETEWVPGKNAKDSTSIPALYEDRFPDDPAASVDDDYDGCPDKWNFGMTQKDSTSEPKLKFDMFPDNPEACLDTDLDGLPDGDMFNTKQWMDKDDDNDLMPDSWELKWNDYAIENGIEHRFDTKNASDGALDWDSDKKNNTEEYLDNSNPFVKDTQTEDGDSLYSIVNFLIAIIVIAIIILVIIFMYTKMRRDQLLEHQVRADILEYVNSNPGVHYRKLLNELDLQMGVLTHHLNMLERQKFIKSLQDSMYRRFYPVNTPINNKLILSDIQRSILEKVRTQPGISQADISRQLNLAKKVVSYHIKILSDADFVRMEMTGRKSQLFYLDGLDLGQKPPRFRRPPRAA